MDLTYLVKQLERAQNPQFDWISVGIVESVYVGHVSVREWSGGIVDVNGIAESGDAVSFANSRLIENFGKVEIEQIEVN